MRLEFNGKSYIYSHHLTVPYSPLVPDPKRSLQIEDVGEGLEEANKIIHGDNLISLKALLPNYAGKVDAVIIDPPYNTGNEKWAYNDNVNGPLMKKWLEKNKPVDGEDLQRHDKWLCMMWPRLSLLKELMADTGAIFITADDNEQPRLRLVMDEIFGEENFVANLVWRKKAGGGQDSGYFAVEHDYILVYRKSEKFKINDITTPILETDFKEVKNGRKCKFIPLEKWGSGKYRTDSPTLYYAITDPDDGSDFYPMASDGRDGRWRSKPENFDEEHIHWREIPNSKVIEERRGRRQPCEVQYFDEQNPEKEIKERSILYDLASTTNATQEIKAIFGEKVFDTPKPLKLYKRLITLAAGPDALVLDSFAGSGTTAHAVMDLNADDGGSRNFLLVECEDYADTITAERIRRVIHGISNAKSDRLANGYNESFVYYTLGNPIEESAMLDGTNLPSFHDMATSMLHLATGQSVVSSEVVEGDGPCYTEGGGGSSGSCTSLISTG